ncbi:hypothetical protein [Parasphingorhabdus sp.]|uniref:hypothetical protein n=1 Tax=Parasphingorhabdus sp. TaxID=2709688 RepID=UPI003002C003
MAKEKCDDLQLSLEFKTTEISESAPRKAPIMQFVDGPTRRLRAEAIHRVATAGIFESSVRYKSR